MTDIASLVLAVDARQPKEAAAELDRLTAAGTRTEAATNSLGASQVRAASQFQAVAQAGGQARQGMQQLGYQLGDIATMFSLGAKPSQIFASQIGQVTQAVQMMSGGTSRLAAFLGGPWGIALSVGAIALTPLISKLFEAESGTNALREAETRLAASMTDLADSRAELDAALGRNIGQYRELRVAAIEAGIAELEGAQAAVAARRTALGEAQENRGTLGYLSGLGTGANPAGGSSAAAGIAGLFGFGDTADEVVDLTNATAELNSQSAELTRLTAGLQRILNGGGSSGGGLAGAASQTGRALREQSAGMSEAERAVRDQNNATAAFIASMESEIATLGLSGEALRQYEVAQQMANATNQEARDRIEELNIARLEAIGIIEREAQALDTVRESEAKRNATQDAMDQARKDSELFDQEEAERQIEDLAGLYTTLFTDGADGVWEVFRKQGMVAISDIAARWISSMGAPGGNGGIGGLLGSLGAAASANPAAAFATATQLSNQIGKGLAGLIGVKYDEGAGSSFGIVGGIIGGLFGSTKYGTASLTGSGAASITSKGKGRADTAGDLGGSVQSALQDIAAALGVSVGGYNVSIGTYKDSFRVSGSGKTGKLKGGDVQDFGEDSAAAIAFALTDAIKDGAILASQSIRNLLGSGSDVQAQIEKAVAFKSVFDALLEATDPVAAAMKNIAEQGAALRKIFDEAGASAAEYADLEKLLTLKREEAVEAAKRSKLDELTDTFSLQIRMLQLLGKGEEALTAARIIEIAGMKAALQPLQAMVYELEDARGVIEKFGPLGDTLRAFKDELIGGAGSGSFAAITARFRGTAGDAATGDASALAAFQGDASAYLDAARANASSALEYQRALSEVLVGTDKGIFAADTQVQMAQLQIDAIANQTNVIANMATNLNALGLQTVANTGALLRLMQRAEGDGLLIRTEADSPLAVTTP